MLRMLSRWDGVGVDWDESQLTRLSAKSLEWPQVVVVSVLVTLFVKSGTCCVRIVRVCEISC